MPPDPMVHVVEDDAAMRDSLLLLLHSADIPACGYASAEEFLSSQINVKSVCLLEIGRAHV